MTTIQSTPTSVTVRAQSTSALGILAASMPSGSWARFTRATNQDSVLGVGSTSGSMIHYCNAMPWNPAAKCIEIIGMDHNWKLLRYARFDDPTSSFLLVNGAVPDDVGFGSADTQHGYDHCTINPFIGDLYWRRTTVNSGTIHVFKKTAASSSTFTEIPSVAADGGAETVAFGTCWWSGSFNGAGAQGCYVVFNSGNAVNRATDGQIAAYDPLANTWFFNRNSMAPFYGAAGPFTYHTIIEYSPVHNCAVYGGGGNEIHKIWRLNSDGSKTAMPDVPTTGYAMGLGVMHGVFTADPVTGNFLLLTGTELWELNPTGSGKWTLQTGSRAPPGGVGRPNPSNSSVLDQDGMICVGIPDYGVIAYIKQTSPTNSAFHLYKHA